MSLDVPNATTSPGSVRPLRSLLFAPGNRPRMLAKVGTFGADSVVIDLEDAVPLEEKTAAREAVSAALRAATWTRAYVRVNSLLRKTPFSVDCGAADLEAVVGSGLAGVVLPKVESAAELQEAEQTLADMERAAGLAIGSIDLLPILETALGVLRAYEIASARSRARRLAFGAGDFSTDIDVEWTRDGWECFYARSQIVVASRAAGKEAPIDTVYPRIDDPEGLERETRLARTLGFKGKFCIHPTQVGPINTLMSPSAEEVDRARRIVEAFREAERDGRAAVAVDGRLVDYPIVERAQRLLTLAESLTTERASSQSGEQ